MGIVLLAKAALLGAAIIFVVPVVFFIVVGFAGRHFSLSVEKNSWLATTKSRVIRALAKRCGL